MKIKSFFASCALLASAQFAAADEGMWILSLLSQQNMDAMHQLGCHLSQEQIYSLNNGSLKDAVVIFGGGCTGEIVSQEGLLFTNHHCGYDAIQQVSSVQHNYLRDGFWSASKDEEIPVDGLRVRFLQSIVDVSDSIIPVPDNLSPHARAAVVEEHIRNVERNAQSDDEFTQSEVVSFFGGNQFFLVTYKVFNDIRLVATPPESIGKFGHDTDNWQWPRHTGDFSIFRVYAGPDNQPANFSASNKPFEPKHSLPVSIKGLQPGDFAMTVGYPGSTQRYVSSFGVLQTRDIKNMSRIEPRDIKQQIWLKAMQADNDTYIKYSVKYANSSNYYKNSIGMNRGIDNLNVVKRKRAEEKAFSKWVKSAYPEHSHLLSDLKKAYSDVAPYEKAFDYWLECLYAGPEILRFAASISYALRFDDDRTVSDEQIDAVLAKVDDFYKDYIPSLDQEVLANLLFYYNKNIDKQFHPEFFDGLKSLNDFSNFSAGLFAKSIFAKPGAVRSAIENGDFDAVRNDVAAICARDVMMVYLNEISQPSESLAEAVDDYERLYILLRMKMNPDADYYSDANFTCRLSYGKVGGYVSGSKKFDFFTDLDGVMAKEDPNNWEFVVDPKLKALYNNKDFGRYADKDGRMHVCFITDNDITGGNSGSPVINADGQLVGLAFDGNWEAMSGDIIFEPDIQRCICVDVRYVLFVIEKFGGAKNIIDELNVVM